MISLITPIKFNTPVFTGKGNNYRMRPCGYDSFEYYNEPKFRKIIFNYSLAEQGESEEISPYKGPTSKDAGFSTEEGGWGGGWLIANCMTPLSTTDVNTCAVLNLVNEDTGKQALFHVHHKTPLNRIEEFINEKFPDFTKVNIVGGNQFPTVNTIKKIVAAVDNVNPYADKIFYYTKTENPQLVAYCGDMYYMKGKDGQLSFVQNTENYWY